ncbi:ACP S-malonyltransferase [Thiolinea disciformis]|uniref:ACP S-malonyltransferase n=1 Tax=Thiolinea disciformis TaxID=125614 RepID=UPI00037D406C|nr:ACP S-malonyltransferase [Thiolinea disciformis]
MSIAGLFPGQGSQSQGMLTDLASAFPIVNETFAQASQVLGRDLWQIVQHGPETALNSTENTQPLMLTAGVATWRVWQQQGGCVPVVMAGHSLGEYSALVAAGALDFAEAVSVVAERARLMQSAVPEGLGAMAAVLGMDDAEVMAACADAAQSEVVEAVNFNSPGQLVIAGHSTAIDRAIEALKARGGKKIVKLSVSVPSHCALMQPAATLLAKRLAEVKLKLSTLPVFHNVDAKPRTTAVDIAQALTEQLYRPVRWTDTVKALQQQFAIKAAVEFGPGKVLTGLNKRIDKQIEAVAVYDQASLEAALKVCGA